MTASEHPHPSAVLPKELSLPRLLAFALPAMPVAAFQLPFVILVPNFYAEHIGLGFSLVGIIIVVARLLDAILDPLIGYFADTTEVRWGRRRIWCALAAIPMTLGAVFVFNPFVDIAYSNVIFWSAWLFVWSVLLSVGYTGLSLSHQSWGAEVSLSYFGRNRIFAAREVAAVIGTLIATALPWILSELGYQGDAIVLKVLSILVVISLPIFILLLVSFVPEPPHIHQHHHHSLVEGLKGLFKNEYFMRLLGAYVLTNMGNAVPATLLVLFSRDYVHASEGAQRLILLVYFLFGVLSTPLWLWLSHKTSKHRAWSVAMLVACGGFAWTPLIGYNLLGSWSPIAFGIVMAIAGMSVGADLMLPVSIQADVIDVDTARTGEQHTGFYFAAWALANKIGLAIALLGLLVLGIVGFKSHEATQPPNAITAPAGPDVVMSSRLAPAGETTSHNRHIAPTSDAPIQQTTLALFTLVLLNCVVPILLKLGAVKLVWNFPIGANEQAKLREAIEAQLLKDA